MIRRLSICARGKVVLSCRGGTMYIGIGTVVLIIVIILIVLLLRR
jgi:hypothetical protein